MRGLDMVGDAVITRTLVLPRLVAGRDYADDMIDAHGDVSGADVVVDATGLRSGTASFAAQLVARLLNDGKASSMLLVGAPADFAGYAVSAARELGVTDRFDLGEDMPSAAAN